MALNAGQAESTRSCSDRKGNVILTGASSGLGLATAKALGESGKWHIIMACRDFLKAERMARSVGIPKENYTVMHLDLASLESIRQFADNFRRSGIECWYKSSGPLSSIPIAVGGHENV